MAALVFFLVAFIGWGWGVRTLLLLWRGRQALCEAKRDRDVRDAVELNRIRFVNYLAHETRTFVGSIQGGLALIAMDPGPVRVKLMAGILDATSRRSCRSSR